MAAGGGGAVSVGTVHIKKKLRVYFNLCTFFFFLFLILNLFLYLFYFTIANSLSHRTEIFEKPSLTSAEDPLAFCLN